MGIISFDSSTSSCQVMNEIDRLNELLKTMTAQINEYEEDESISEAITINSGDLYNPSRKHVVQPSKTSTKLSQTLSKQMTHYDNYDSIVHRSSSSNSVLLSKNQSGSFSNFYKNDSLLSPSSTLMEEPVDLKAPTVLPMNSSTPLSPPSTLDLQPIVSPPPHKDITSETPRPAYIMNNPSCSCPVGYDIDSEVSTTERKSDTPLSALTANSTTEETETTLNAQKSPEDSKMKQNDSFYIDLHKQIYRKKDNVIQTNIDNDSVLEKRYQYITLIKQREQVKVLSFYSNDWL